MDYKTKLYQYPIEQMFKFICQFIDNEIITVPSAQRAGLIHHKIFEYRSEKYDTYYFTMDCRKWAPRSNPDKYLYMLLGMIDILPMSFVNSVVKYFSVHKEKEIHIRSAIHDLIMKNPQNRELGQLLNKNEETESSYFVMPYSFVMGIFNMLSSLMHAGIQKLAKNEIEMSLMSDCGKIDFDLTAHSDDSAGRLSVIKGTDKKIIKQVINSYESFQKACNHLMSHKKSVVSTKYFELLSILYVNHELLPLIPKFLGNVSLTFTGSGLSQDMKQVISKSIELQMNGATASQAYKSQIILSNMYRNFYRVEEDMKLTALGGFSNCWPTLYLCYGAAADEISLLKNDPVALKQVTTFAVKNLDYESTNGTLTLKMKNVLRMPVAYKSFQKKISLPQFEDSDWFFQNNKTNHSLLNVLWFRSMLESDNFGVALLNINDIRKAYDSLYMSSGKHIKGKTHLYSIQDVNLSIMETVPEENRLFDYLKITYRSLLDYLSWMENANPDFKASYDLSYKPCSLDLVNFPEAPISNFNSFNLAIELIRPDLLPWTFSNRRYGKELTLMNKYLENLGLKTKDVKDVKNFLDFLNKSKTTNTKFYAKLPSDSRKLNGIEGFHQLICQNYHSKFIIETDINVSYLNKTTNFDLSETKRDVISMFYFYCIWKEARIPDLNDLPVKIKGMSTISLNSIPSVLDKVDENNSLSIMKLLEYSEDRTIVLNNFDCWAIWTDRQIRIGSEWVGKGKLLTKIDNTFILIEVQNREVKAIKIMSKTKKVFSNNASYFLNKLIASCKLNIYQSIVTYDDRLYFGLNAEGLITIDDGSTVRLGVQHTSIDNYMDVSMFDQPRTHSFNYGRHYLNLYGFNSHIYTIDEFIFKENKKSIIDYINWQVVEPREKEILFETMFDGKYGDLPELEYNKSDLTSRFLQTDIYKLFYNKTVKQKLDLFEVFWNNMVSNSQASNDIFPTLFENLPLENLEKIMPEKDMERIKMLTFFENDNPEILNFYKNLQNISDQEGKMAYIITVLENLKSGAEVLLLPEIGNPEEFLKYSVDMGYRSKLNSDIVTTALKDLSNAMFEGILSLSEVVKSKIGNLVGFDLNNLDDLYFLMFERAYGNFKLCDYNALTHRQICSHRILEAIFNERSSMISFGRALRGTTLKNLPRHPRYKQEYHALLANLNKFIQKFGVQAGSLPACFMRFRLTEIKYFNEEINNLNIKTPPLLTYFFNLNDFPEASARDLYNNCIDSVQNDIKFATTTLEDLKDDMEEDYLFVRRKPIKNYRIALNTREQIYLLSNYQPCFGPIYIPNMKGYEMQIGRYKLFAYNINEDIAKTNNLRPIRHKNYKIHGDFINYYKESSFDIQLIIGRTEKKTVDLSFEIKERKLTEKVSVYNTESYNSDLFSSIASDFNLTESEREELENLVNSKNYAPTKFITLKQFIKNKNKSVNENKVIEDFIKTALDKELKLEISKENISQIDLISTVESDKNKLIENLTSYKKEFKQMNCVLDKHYGNILTKQLSLTEGVKRNLISQCKMLIRELTLIKKKNEAARLRVTENIIKTINIGTPNSESVRFDEEMRMVFTNMNELIEIESEESEIDEPEYKTEAFKIG
jgi:hypothetical protein